MGGGVVNANVERVRAESLSWPFRNDSTPKFSYGTGGQVDLDPFPCYPHDVDVVLETLEHVYKLWPLDIPLNVWVAEFEELARSNAHATRTWDYYSEGRPATAQIFMSGKRTPPHPGMTRALIGHEYGHQVEWSIARMRGYTGGEDAPHEDTLIEEYAEVRGAENCWGSGGKWHRSATEIFASDFRLLVCGLEPEFWPHFETPRPEDCPDVVSWWETQLGAYGRREAA